MTIDEPRHMAPEVKEAMLKLVVHQVVEAYSHAFIQAIARDFESDRQAAFETFASAAQERALIVLGELDVAIKARVAETSRVIIDQSLATIAEGAGVRLSGTAVARPAVTH
ncbi:hypothetical protein IMF23_15630 [Chelatococcus daeguensis]|uniref:Uncharacterized protein n=2 Tax=Chelatococcus TaxID=28209 RepID=A0AAC9NY20_9HYPH|nr:MULTISPECIES: hypothetical protein [Chelatococcus]APF37084.1 hypothetical protein BOQ54_06850 [Chelatococcus daeguensis]KZE32535.1 hypothetical protein AVW15_01945 [Chelatococcus daeguensis]MBM3084873.1 hypothetical protein [Chelatococcus daeguensis]CUA87879.1 hypothetical protein Ga0061061_10471 [Chelatococcus sambhunathii]